MTRSINIISEFKNDSGEGDKSAVGAGGGYPSSGGSGFGFPSSGGGGRIPPPADYIDDKVYHYLDRAKGIVKRLKRNTAFNFAETIEIAKMIQKEEEDFS